VNKNRNDWCTPCFLDCAKGDNFLEKKESLQRTRATDMGLLEEERK
jgi:hypothetical protein